MLETNKLAGPGAASQPDVTAAGQGVLLAIVGASGSGKDTLIDWLRTRLADRADVLFVTRTVTRDAHAGAEAHDTLSDEAFAAAEAAGAFAVTWEAHGLRYGLPVTARDHVEAGGIAIANGSRRALDAIAGAFANVVVVHLTVTPDVLRQRLEGRGREDAVAIERRLEQASLPLETHLPVIALDNSGPLEETGQRLLDQLPQAAQPVTDR